ncbi:unnamed protein product, partial [Rotaria sp. Silwood2]
NTFKWVKNEQTCCPETFAQDVIILDEVHERDQPMDFLLILIRTLWLRNSQNVKIILMSTTIEIDKLAHYFRQVIDGQIVPAYQFQIGERLFDVQDMY